MITDKLFSNTLLEHEFETICDGFDLSEWLSNGFCVSNTQLSISLLNDLTERCEMIQSGRYEMKREPVIYKKKDSLSNVILEMYSHIHWSDSIFRALVMCKHLAKLSAKLLNTNKVKLWGSSIITKPKMTHESNVIDWHADMDSWKFLDRAEVITFWIPLEDVDENNGCIEFISGSHKMTDCANKINGNVVQCSMKKGQISVHHCLTKHRSLPNISNNIRRAITIHFFSANTRYIAGSDSEGHINSYLSGAVHGQLFPENYFPTVYG